MAVAQRSDRRRSWSGHVYRAPGAEFQNSGRPGKLWLEQTKLEIVGNDMQLLGGRGGGNGPEISGAKGSVKFWVKDGMLSKYEIKVQGKVSFNGNDRDVDRTTTVEIKDSGSTKIQLPEDAKKKLS